MDLKEFMGQVQNRAHLGSLGDAERATRATLQTLADRISEGAANNLASQLPSGVGEYMRHREAATEQGESFGFDEFAERVTEKEGVDKPDAVYHARVVLEVLDEATQGGAVTKVREQLPDEFDRLFAGSQS